MEYHTNGWADLGQGKHVKYALGYTLVITEEPIVSPKRFIYTIRMYSIYGIESIGHEFTLDAATVKAHQWLSRKANEFSTELPAYERAFAEGYSTRVMEEQHGYEPYEK